MQVSDEAIREQVRWEKECLTRGYQKYLAQQDSLKDKGRGDQSDAASFLLRKRVKGIADRLYKLAYKPKGKLGKYNRFLQKLTVDGNFLPVAYIGAQCAFQLVTGENSCTALRICLSISKRLETDLKCRLFELENPGYYHTVMQSLKSAQVQQYEHKHKVLMKKFKDFDMEWNEWDPTTRVQVGSKVMRCVIEEFWDVFFVGKRVTATKQTSIIQTTPLFDDWIAEFEREKGFLHPELLPLKIPPLDWTDLRDGGFYTPQLRNVFRFVKTKSKEHDKFVEDNMPLKHMQAVNKLQHTAWQINRDVLEVQQEVYRRNLGIGIPNTKPLEVPKFPEHLKGDKTLYTPTQVGELKEWKTVAKKIHNDELSRKGQLLGFTQTLRLAQEVADWERLFFAYNCDFRGRVYCATTGLTPQGADNARGLLQFERAVELGESGVHWLAIHGANTFGVDKVSFTDRVKWVKDSEPMLKAIAEDPIGNYTLWENAGKPYQFLAFCFDWAHADYGRNVKYKSKLPVGMDGSCNGLQHFSALLRDTVGADATNLTDRQLPADIYQQVADRCTERLQELGTPYARKWLSVGVTRSCAKRPVMTLPYGATQKSARSYVYEYVLEHWDEFNLPLRYQADMAKFLTPILWASIGDVVVAARVCMDWLRKSVPKNEMVNWLTPLDFPVYQCYKNVEMIRVETQLCGSISMFFCDRNREGVPNNNQHRNGISPNFIHSLDSSHMVMTVLESDLQDYAMIHDDYGTHAGKVGYLGGVTRQTFHDLYYYTDPLISWAKQQGVDLTTVPSKGTYDLEDIHDARYFFS